MAGSGLEQLYQRHRGRPLVALAASFAIIDALSPSR